MTGGTVAVLGRTGKNFGAGMTGGQAFVLDLENRFEALYNNGLIVIDRLNEEDEKLLQGLIYRHLEATESKRAKEILGDWTKFRGAFWKAMPKPPVVKSAPPAKTDAVISEKVIATSRRHSS
jgi:glutamate synthase domain-containing protein 3